MASSYKITQVIWLNGFQVRVTLKRVMVKNGKTSIKAFAKILNVP